MTPMLRHTRVLLPSLALAALPAPVVGIQDTQEWDVSAPRGEARTVSFTTTEGTWMSVDLSPDGRTLVFDLLGDLYALPVEGGQATRITSGPAWDVQPRFSPDGRRIAFTSDRAGGDNLWVMNADGSDPTQVSKESFRLLNGPAWTPDGQYLLGRKHFTSTRSLGAGEVWMYHVGGGSGMRITERRNDQQDQGNEIAVSPDGRYLYFSEDATSGPTFQYNKDPNPGIYRIRRLDRETGDITTISGGPGGAARPVPSPDGEKLALVRRVRGESVLYVRDLATGAEGWTTTSRRRGPSSACIPTSPGPPIPVT
jgi:Tol biopolymer transport system component